MGRLPYDMFNLSASAEDARRLDRTENIYHAGQRLVWDGRKTLTELIARHGGTHVREEHKAPLGRVYASILWGELAAWKIAAQLADRIEPLGPKMAATSQAHDEARHFYVMHDYLKEALGYVPERPTREAERLLSAVLDADDLACKLLGMQLQVETTALTIFQASRQARFCPVLTDLLLYYEKDEARHVGLGLQYLPMLVAKMGRIERARFSAFALRVVYLLLGANRAMAQDLRELGIDPFHMLQLAKSKQLMVFEELWATAPGSHSVIATTLSNVMEAIGVAAWPPPGQTDAASRVRAFVSSLRDGVAKIDTSIEPDAAPAPPPTAASQPS